MATKRVSYIPVVATVADLPDATAYTSGVGIWVLDVNAIYVTDGATWSSWEGNTGGGGGAGDISLDASATVTAGHIASFVDSATITDTGIPAANVVVDGDELTVFASTGASDGQVATADGAGGIAWESLTGIQAFTSAFTLQSSYINQTLRVTGNTAITIPAGLPTAYTVTIVNVGSGTVTFVKSGVTTVPVTLPSLDNSNGSELTFAVLQHAGSNVWDVYAATAEPVTLGFALSDETTALTVGQALSFRMPFAMTLTDVRFDVVTAPTGAALQFDINEGGVSILSTKATIDVSEFSTATAATPPVISDTELADNALITVDVDVIGSTVAGAGAKLWMYGYRV